MSLLDEFLSDGFATPPPPLGAELPEPQGTHKRFRDWWWHEFDCGTDSAEFNAESAEAATGLLPILRNLVSPDFEVVVDGPVLKLRRVCERHYPASDASDEGACGS